MQLVKQDDCNAWELYSHVDLIKSHLGKGLSCNVTLKEMYLGKRRLLNKVCRPVDAPEHLSSSIKMCLSCHVSNEYGPFMS